MNYCGIGKEFLAYTVDKNPHKQNLLLPGTRIPVKSPAEIKRTKPDYIFHTSLEFERRNYERMLFHS